MKEEQESRALFISFSSYGKTLDKTQFNSAKKS